MKKKVFGIIVLIGIVCICGGCFNKCNVNEEINDKPIENTIISYNDIKTMENLVDIAFVEEKESLSVDDYDDEQKVAIANELVKKGYTETTGTEMTNEFRKYFGKDQKLNFVDIKCSIDHGSEDENIMLKFDDSQDKYVYNDNHPGHGGAGDFIGSKFSFDSIEKTENGYKVKVGILFYDGITHDTGPNGYGSAYKSYSDAKEEKNALVKIDGNDKYKENIYEFPTYDLDKVVEDCKDKLEMYTFTFENVDNNIVFIKYDKK